jgi:hypothetical protein
MKSQNPRRRRIVSDTGSWKSQDSSSSGVPKSQNVKHRNPKSRRIVSDTGRWRNKDPRLFIIGVLKCQNVKLRNEVLNKVVVTAGGHIVEEL